MQSDGDTDVYIQDPFRLLHDTAPTREFFPGRGIAFSLCRELFFILWNFLILTEYRTTANLHTHFPRDIIHCVGKCCRCLRVDFHRIVFLRSFRIRVSGDFTRERLRQSHLLPTCDRRCAQVPKLQLLNVGEVYSGSPTCFDVRKREWFFHPTERVRGL